MYWYIFSNNNVFSSRVVIVSGRIYESGKMHWDDLNWEKRKYSSVESYKQSKLANILHAKELSRRVEADGISVYVLHPGVISSEFARHMMDNWYGKIVHPILGMVLKTPRQGAQTTLYCCLEESIAKESGKYYRDCKEAPTLEKANNVEDQKKLWEISERLVGINATD